MADNAVKVFQPRSQALSSRSQGKKGNQLGFFRSLVRLFKSRITLTTGSDFFKSRTFLLKRKFDFKISKVNLNQIDQRVVVGSLKKSLFDG
jgi:hypothetical protein